MEEGSLVSKSVLWPPCCGSCEVCRRQPGVTAAHLTSFYAELAAEKLFFLCGREDSSNNLTKHNLHSAKLTMTLTLLEGLRD